MKTEYILKTFENMDISESSYQDIIFEDCEFINCSFSEVSLKNCLFSNCRFIKTAVINPKFKRTEALGVSFENASLIGIDWSMLADERKRAMHFLPFDKIQKSAVRHSVFYGLSLRKMDFSACDLSGSYFDECDLAEALFTGADLTSTVFSHCDLRKADFTHARGYYFSVESNQIKGARFSLPEVLELLRALDIEIETD